jgi:hypothetical protein
VQQQQQSKSKQQPDELKRSPVGGGSARPRPRPYCRSSPRVVPIIGTPTTEEAIMRTQRRNKKTMMTNTNVVMAVKAVKATSNLLSKG